MDLKKKVLVEKTDPVPKKKIPKAFNEDIIDNIGIVEKDESNSDIASVNSCGWESEEEYNNSYSFIVKKKTKIVKVDPKKKLKMEEFVKE